MEMPPLGGNMLMNLTVQLARALITILGMPGWGSAWLVVQWQSLTKTHATFNGESVLRCWAENDNDVVDLHEFGDGFKLWVHTKVCDDKIC